MASSSHSTGSLEQLNQRIRAGWPQELGNNSWYLSIAAALIACSRPTMITPLYLSIAETTPEASTEMMVVSERLKDVFMKTWTITGIPSVITAVSALAAAEADFKPSATIPPLQAQKAASYYEGKQLNSALEKQGHDFMLDIYRHNLDPIMSTWGNHQHDFEWLEKRVIYGLFLSDHKILSAIETEIVVLSAMMCQELKPPAIWHIRGIRRLGASKEEVQTLLDLIKQVAAWCGKDTREWLNIAQVEDQV